MPPDVKLIAFSDDIALVGTSKIQCLLKKSLEEAYKQINRWMVAHGLELTAEKNGFINKRVRNEVTGQCGGYSIRSTPSLKYLDVQLDKKLNFVE